MVEYKKIPTNNVEELMASACSIIGNASQADLIGICCHCIDEVTKSWVANQGMKMLDHDSHSVYVMTILAEQVVGLHLVESMVVKDEPATSN